jgi:DNA repair exonuclease SbcCD nuclease subunit
MIDRSPRRALKLVHTSDVHLGCDYNGKLARRALAAVVDTAVSIGADALILAGDVFDHNRVREDEVRFLLDQLDRSAMPSIILPGNHDCYDAGSVYHREAFQHGPAGVHVIDDRADTLCQLPELDLEVWGRAVVDHHPGFRPLTEEPPRRTAGWRVGVAHGHFGIPDPREPRSSPILPEDVASSLCDYVALGHWDGYADVSQGGVPAFYSGAPHWSGVRRELSRVLVLTLDPERGALVRAEPLVEL